MLAIDDWDLKALHGDLARLFVARKVDLGMSKHEDAEIEAGVDDIALCISARIGFDLATGDHFTDRFSWLVEASNRLDGAQPSVPRRESSA